MTTPDRSARDEATLIAQLASLGAPPEAALLDLASRLFKTGLPPLERLTGRDNDAETDQGRQRPVRADGERAEPKPTEAGIRYQTLVEQIPAVTFMAVLGEGEHQLYVSPHIEALLGFTQAEWLEDPSLWYRQLHPDDRALWIEEFVRGCRTGGPFLAECRFIARDGSIVWVRGEARLVKDNLGRPSFLQGVAFDTTESKRAQDVMLRQAVRTTETRYRDVVQGIGAIFWEADAHTLGLTFVSAQAERILGFPTARWLEEPDFWITLVHPEDREHVAGEWQAAATDGTDREMDYRAVTAAGQVVWLHNRIHVARDANGKPTYLLGFMLDVTDRRRAEHERARLLAREQEARAEAETLNRIGRQLVAELDLTKLVQAITDAGTELTGAEFGVFIRNEPGDQGERYTVSTLSGGSGEADIDLPLSPIPGLFEPTFRDRGIVRLDDIDEDPRFGGSAASRPGQRPLRSYLAVPVSLHSGEVLGGLVFGHPECGRFTERHERLLVGLAAQAAIAMDNARLYRAADEARQTAEAANRAKDEFLATLSHELRTPLTAVLGWTHMLRKRSVDGAEMDHALEVIERNAAMQAQLIDDLLDVSRIVVGKFQIELVPIGCVGPIVEAAIESLRWSARTKDIALTATVDREAGPILGDARRLQQVVWNLLSNAVKFTPPRGRVEISCARRGPGVLIAVRDTGQGIAPEFLPRLFDRFTQADSTTTRAHGGLGLGLAIVRHLVEMHGGTVRAESRGEGQGATFTVTLPLVAGASE
ncbi:MAG: histidine kinase [Candidatus Rokuibacteriota bacterium]|nr:MAG: histidine kinase [Candidatus Rokubacteria bacterium]